jgi:hypothetical protein
LKSASTTWIWRPRWPPSQIKRWALNVFGVRVIRSIWSSMPSQRAISTIGCGPEEPVRPRLPFLWAWYSSRSIPSSGIHGFSSNGFQATARSWRPASSSAARARRRRPRKHHGQITSE